MEENGIFGSLVSVGTGAATGNPIGMAAGIAGLGLSIFGGAEKMAAAKQKADAQRQITSAEMQQDDVRRKAMELSARRQQMEVLRNAQRARSLALNNATSQGAQFGSGLQGGYGQIAGATNWNLAGINQNLSFGEQMFDLNKTISQQKLNVSDSESRSSTGSALSGLGGMLMSNTGTLKNLGGNFVGTGGPSGSSGSYGGTGGGLGGLY